MPRRDDLIGLLRSLDEAMKDASPRPGHEARMRERLARSAGSRLPARTLVLAFATLAAGAATWIALSSPEDVDPVAVPLGPPPASAEIVAEPAVAPSGSARAPRPSPRRAIPALPILPPHGELAPAPDPAREPARSPLEAEPSRDRTNEKSARADDPRAPIGLAEAPRAPARPSSRGKAAGAGDRSSAVAWSAPNAEAGASRGGSLSMLGTIAGEPHAAGSQGTSPSKTSASHGASGGTGAPAGSQACETFVLDFVGVCVSADVLKDLAFDMCDAKSTTLTGLDSPLDCGGGATSVTVTCCPEEAETSTPESTGACKAISAGDGETCLDVAILEEQALAICTSWGMTLAKPAPTNPCSPTTATWIDALCCPPEAPASEPSPAGLVGDGKSCTLDDKLADIAADQCQSQGLSLVDFSPADDCEADVSTIAKYACGK